MSVFEELHDYVLFMLIVLLFCFQRGKSGWPEEKAAESETYPRKMGELPRPINQQRRQRYETFQTADVVQLLSSKDLYCVFTTFHHKIGSDREKDKSN